jgi:hypothetical protein
MTRGEWETIAVALDHLWPGDFTDEDSAAWYLVMRNYPAQAIETAVQQLAAKLEWRPFPAAVIQFAETHDEWSRRRARWLENFTSLEYTFGRAVAIEQCDPERKLESHYPPEPVAGTTYATRRRALEVGS